MQLLGISAMSCEERGLCWTGRPRYAAAGVSWQGQANDAGSNESGSLNLAAGGSSQMENTWRSVI